VTAVPTVLAERERVGGHAVARQTVLARSAIAPYTRRIVDPPRFKFLSRRRALAAMMTMKKIRPSTPHAEAEAMPGRTHFANGQPMFEQGGARLTWFFKTGREEATRHDRVS
jgi:hypothetical protein